MAAAGGMQDSYVGGIINSSLIPQNTDPFYVTLQDQQDIEKENATDDVLTSVLLKGKSNGWSNDLNQTDEDKMVNLTCKDDDKQTNLNRTEEYNVDYTGLSILPWEDFVFNPRVFNDLFYAESNQRITFDPEEVNVFFHGQNVMPPTIGDISLNGKSWNIEVDSISNLRKVRQWLTEKCSVFGVTLQYKEKRFGKPVNVPCLVMIDPNRDSIGDRLYTTLTRAMDSLHNQRRFCVEINLNSCIERWCERVLFTNCKAIGAKLVITNGEEYANLNGTEDIICCVFCLPIWLLQTGIYKLHRSVTYDDFMIDFTADDLFFHGSFQDSQCQRQHILNDNTEKSVFRTRNAQNTDPATLDRLGTHKFVSVKKIKKSDKNMEEVIKERTTGTFGDLVDKRKDKILKKDVGLQKMLLEKENKLKNESKSNKTTSNENKGADNRSKTLETVNEHVNEAYTSDGEERKDEQKDTLRLPEIASQEYNQDDEKSPDIEVPSEVRENSSMYLRPTDSIDALLTFSEKKRKKCIDNKSMTAVCSFENFDQVSETDTSESDEEDEEEQVPKATAGKDNLLDEMLKIEKSLPVVATVNKAKDVSELKEEEKGATNADTEKERKSKHNKIKVGRVLKDLMKTTEKHNDQLPSIQDPKYLDSKNKLQMKAQSTKDSKKLSSSATEKTQTKEVTKQSSDKLEPSNKSNQDIINSKEDVESSPDTDNKVESLDKTRFSISSSSDGDTVEMLYESHRSMTDVTSFGSDTENQTADKLQKLNSEFESNTSLDYIARANIPKYNKAAKSEVATDMITKESDEGKNDIGRKSKDSFMHIDEDNPNIDCIKLQGRTLIGVQRMQSFLDVTDMDDLNNELDDPGTTMKPAPNVPSLKLDSLNKKTKRGTKQYNSNRRYLGAALPNKQKKRFT